MMKMLNGKLVEMTLEEMDSLRVEKDPAEAAAVERAEARAYLSATDWFVTRQVETGKPVPDDIAAKRAEARKKAQA